MSVVVQVGRSRYEVVRPGCPTGDYPHLEHALTAYRLRPDGRRASGLTVCLDSREAREVSAPA